MHCTRPAKPEAASESSACHSQIVAKVPEQRHVFVAVETSLLPINVQIDHARHLSVEDPHYPLSQSLMANTASAATKPMAVLYSRFGVRGSKRRRWPIFYRTCAVLARALFFEPD
jgi:hypothetical protein